ncbi:hypothetical protein KR215_002926, partial [Drosophila sulfurigaster]
MSDLYVMNLKDSMYLEAFKKGVRMESKPWPVTVGSASVNVVVDASALLSERHTSAPPTEKHSK